VTWSLPIEGQAVQEGQKIRRWAEQTIVLNPDPNVTSPMLTFRQMAAGLAGPDPFAVRGPAAIEVVKGYPTSVPIKVTWTLKQAAAAVELTGVMPALLPGQVAPAATTLTFKPGTAAAGAAAGTFTVTAGLAVPEGRFLDLPVQGKARRNNQDRTVSGPAISLTVRNPFAVELLTASLTGAAGQTIILKGRLKRQAVFKEPVTVGLARLPKGVTLTGRVKPIPGNQSDFTIALRVDPKAGPATASLTLTCSTTIGGAAFSHSPVTVPVKVAAGN
jgi:hypothetical protein